MDATPIEHLPAGDERLTKLRRLDWLWPLALFALCFAVLLRTLAPTIYWLDSSEFAVGAATLGIGHPPGYPLYLLIAHLFTRLPIGDVGYRVNLLAAFSLALTAPILFAALRDLIEERGIAACVTLVFIFSYYVWAAGVAAEIYAEQLLTVVVCLWLVIRMARRPMERDRLALWTGLALGVAVAMHPSSALLAPAVALTFMALRVPFRRCLAAGALSLAVFAVVLLYFPIRYAALPALNIAGSYDGSGQFLPVNLAGVSGLVWYLSGGQFRGLFFDQGLTLAQLGDTLTLFWRDFLGIGLLIGVVGAGLIARRSRRWFAIGLVAFVPYCLFYTGYDVVDRTYMFGPALLLWTIPLAFGLRWCLQPVPPRLRSVLLLVAPLAMFAVNFPLLDLSHDSTPRDRAVQTLAVIPQNAIIVGGWLRIMPIEYLQIIVGDRPDTTLYNGFLFDSDVLGQFVVKNLLHPDRPLVFLADDPTVPFIIDGVPSSLYTASPLQITDPSGGPPIIVGYLIKAG